METIAGKWLALLARHKAIAVIRCDNLDWAYHMALSAAAGGIKLIEITWNSDRPQQLIPRLRMELPHCIVGVGTILHENELIDAVAAGAQFAFAPNFNPHLLDLALERYQIPFVPGAFSPTEIVNAWQQGAKAIKVFPIKSLGGADYLKCLQAPLKEIALIPTGGITLDNATQMLDAGATAVGISSSLFLPEDIALQDWQAITNRTKFLLKKLHQ